ncbi:MAG: hypothetical protein Q4Q28_07755 [Bacteroidales bacterium]|nr:hypothetical protein [Bacteroidales bacterium]
MGLTKIVPLRGTGSFHSLWLGRTKARPYRVAKGGSRGGRGKDGIGWRGRREARVGMGGR